MRWCMMRKIVLCMVVICCLPFTSAQAAAKIDLAIDGVIVPTERTEENNTPFYLDARPQMRSNSVFVPVRVVSEILGADVSWENPNINIKYEDLTINLTVGSRTAYRGEQKITLPAAPYVRGGYTYVPIRFVSEAFNCDVEWQAKKNLVNIKISPWELNGQQIVGVAQGMNMGTREVKRQANSPYFAKAIYQKIKEELGEEIVEPNYSWLVPEHFEGDNSLCYMLDWVYFMLVDEDNAALRIELYSLCRGQSEDKYVLKLDNKWYAVPESLSNDLYSLFEQSDNFGFEYYKQYNLLGQNV